MLVLTVCAFSVTSPQVLLVPFSVTSPQARCLGVREVHRALAGGLAGAHLEFQLS